MGSVVASLDVSLKLGCVEITFSIPLGPNYSIRSHNTTSNDRWSMNCVSESGLGGRLRRRVVPLLGRLHTGWAVERIDVNPQSMTTKVCKRDMSMSEGREYKLLGQDPRVIHTIRKV